MAGGGRGPPPFLCLVVPGACSLRSMKGRGGGDAGAGLGHRDEWNSGDRPGSPISLVLRPKWHRILFLSGPQFLTL